MGHYNEPVLDISLPVHNTDYKIIYKLNYNPMTGIWTIEMPKDLGERQFHFLASFVNFQFIDLNSLFL
jgi:hypothetical protein